MFKKSKQKEKKPNPRNEKAAQFFDRNKVFLIMVLLVIIALCSGNIFENRQKEKVDTNVNSEAAQTEPEEYNPDWNFYWSDLIVFVAAGGFCTVMILKEKRKAKEELR